MGKQTNLYYVGSRRNLVYYQLNGGYYVRTKPVVVRQTPATRTCAGHFGTAVKISKALRDGLAPLLPQANKRQVAFNLNTALYQWLLNGAFTSPAPLQTVPALQNFQFNAKAGLSERLKPALQVQWSEGREAVVSIPALNPARNIAAPAHTEYIALQLTLATCSLGDFSISYPQKAEVLAPYGDAVIAAQDVHLPWQPKAGSLSIVVASLRYHVKQQYALPVDRQENWQPAAIVEALWQPKETGHKEC